ncbi:MAG TPA: FAD-binding oxidoreductase [Pyrinomonadaceae bacterium]|jgi:FAD/FMN-containing dehydrogenase
MKKQADYFSLIELAVKNKFKLTCPWDGTYQKASKIWNRRLQTGPAMIAFCSEAKHVQVCVNWCRTNSFPFRVRSGGHHHEGMSCDYGVLIIDLSLMSTITYEGDALAWIPPGKQLQYVYAELAKRGKIIPGGGCETVCVGGLTLGGGWGMSARIYGLTCDSLQKAEIVLADGTLQTVDEGNLPKLFWALKGGGVGSFGIVTNFLFKLSPAPQYVSFTLIWKSPGAIPKILEAWLKELSGAGAPDKITTVCRLFHNSFGGTMLEMDGRIYGTLQEAKQYTSQFTSLFKPDDETYTEKKNVSASAKTEGEAASAPLAPSHFAESKHPVIPKRPADTCVTGPLPHKISSAFAKNSAIVKLGQECLDFMVNERGFARVNTYVSFHSFGGAIGRYRPDETAFPWRDRKLLLQFQAWWSNPNDKNTDQYIQWIEDFRTTLASKGLTDGGFFNFQDASVRDNKYDLLKYYLGNNLDTLIRYKNEYDPNDLFNFPMSIPHKREH